MPLRAPSSRVERVLLTAGTIALFVGGYFGVGRSLDPAAARELRTTLDTAIPFVPWTVWIYLSIFPAALIPLFVIRSRELFRRTILAYAAVIVVSLAVFVAFPVTSRDLRPDPATLDPSNVSHFAIRVLYAADPPTNLFPSLHLSIATLAAMSAWKARRAYGILAVVGTALIGVSIATVKQHFVLDGIGGVALAAIAYGWILRPFAPAPGEAPGYSWLGPAAYVVLLGAVHAGFWIAFQIVR